MAEVLVRYHPSVQRLRLRELSGSEELLVELVATEDAVRLIDGALVAGQFQSRFDPYTLAAPDRDRILASIYQQAFGPRIDSTVHCVRCSSLFDLSFRIGELSAELDRIPEQTTAGIEQCAPGVFRAGEGWTFRLPTAADELAAAGRPDAMAWLARQCLLDHENYRPTVEQIDQAIEEAAPILDVELDACCPECEARQKVRFDVQSYLLQTILRERPRLWRSVHRIASAYHWSLQEILGLSRSQRHILIDEIESAVSGRHRVAR